MSNALGPISVANQYPAYHLDSIQQQLGKTAWRDILPVFAHVRMATYGQLDEYLDDLSEGAIRRALNAMVKARDTAGERADERENGADDDLDGDEHVSANQARRVLICRRRGIVYRAGERKPQKLYQLGAAGSALLREMGLVNDLRPSRLKKDVDIAHRLCILDVVLKAQKAGIDAVAEKVLRNEAGKEIRADMAVPSSEGTGGWRLIEVEQRAQFKDRRRAERLESLRLFFAGPGSDAASPEIVVVFNLPADEMNATVEEWQHALREAEQKNGALPFRLYSVWLPEFMADPRWNGPQADDRILLPQANERVEARQAEIESARARRAEAREARAPLVSLDRLEAKSQADLIGLFQKAYAIYAPSRVTADWHVKLGVPVTSLQALRAWLERARLVEVLREEFEDIKHHYSPPIAEQMLGRVVWTRLLRPWGVERQILGLAQMTSQQTSEEAEFRVSVGTGKALDKSAGYAGMYVWVTIGAKLWDVLKAEREAAGLAGVDRETMETAVGWLLSAPWTYAEELRLLAGRAGGQSNRSGRHKRED